MDNLELLVRELQSKEHDAWLNLVRKLEKSGAVTEEDSKSPSAAHITPGQRLYYSIREWGEALVVLRVNRECVSRIRAQKEQEKKGAVL